MLGVLPPLQDACGHQGAEAGGKRVARRAGAPGHLVKPAVAEEDLPDGEQSPFLADQLKGARNGARPRLRCWGCHNRQYKGKSQIWTYCYPGN
jgi:hypothetical protein